MDDLKANIDNESCSRSITETANGSHQFIIEGYSLLTGALVAGQCITSGLFKVGGYDWALQFYPYGRMINEGTSYASLFLALACDVSDHVTAVVDFSLVDQVGEDHRDYELGLQTFLYRGDMRGCRRFARRTTFEEEWDFIKNDCVIINCNVGVVKTRTERPNPYSIPVGSSDSMGKRYKELLESEIGSDVVFEVGDETFKAHKLILAASSPVFKAQFYGLVGDLKLDRVVIEEMEPLIFKGMLSFIYTNTYPDDIIESNSVHQLLAAADRYSLDELKLLCESKLCDQLCDETAATTLALAAQYGCSQLKDICLKFAASPANLGAVLQSEGYNHLEESWPGLSSEILRTVALRDGYSYRKRRRT